MVFDDSPAMSVSHPHLASSSGVLSPNSQRVIAASKLKEPLITHKSEAPKMTMTVLKGITERAGNKVHSERSKLPYLT